ncbi:hypothetical protein D3C83_74550 [compost metagenome]
MAPSAGRASATATGGSAGGESGASTGGSAGAGVFDGSAGSGFPSFFAKYVSITCLAIGAPR